MNNKRGFVDTNLISYFLKLADLFSFESEADVIIGIFTFSHELQTSQHCFTNCILMHFESSFMDNSRKLMLTSPKDQAFCNTKTKQHYRETHTRKIPTKACPTSNVTHQYPSVLSTQSTKGCISSK